MIYRISIKDVDALAKLAIQMWTDHSLDDLKLEFKQLIEDDESACFIKYLGDLPIAFAQCGLRYDYVEGTNSSPVGYLEGIFVLEEYRKHGYAKELLEVCEKWAKDKGCTEFASDCELNNVSSFKFHLALGFEETNRIICFKKKL